MNEPKKVWSFFLNCSKCKSTLQISLRDNEIFNNIIKCPKCDETLVCLGIKLIRDD